jgi:head-tail adaptor
MKRRDRSTARELDSFVRLERPVADDSFDGAGSGEWVLVDEIWAGIQDVLPSRAEDDSEGITTLTRRARLRIRARGDVTPAMRFVKGDRLMHIVAGPADLKGRPPRQEFMVEDYRPAGNPA